MHAAEQPGSPVRPPLLQLAASAMRQRRNMERGLCRSVLVCLAAVALLLVPPGIATRLGKGAALAGYGQLHDSSPPTTLNSPDLCWEHACPLSFSLSPPDSTLSRCDRSPILRPQALQVSTRGCILRD